MMLSTTPSLAFLFEVLLELLDPAPLRRLPDLGNGPCISARKKQATTHPPTNTHRRINQESVTVA
jgi:hypothetical protein